MFIKSISYSVFSGLLLALGTPSTGIWQLSFVAFIPFLFSIDNQFNHGKDSFFQIYLLGFLFTYTYVVSCFYWIANMNLAAMFAAAAIYALVYSLFAPGIILAFKAKLNRTSLFLWIVFLWVTFETALSDIFLPIPSMALGYLISPLKTMIQISDITGVFGVSFWIIAINVLIFSLIKDGVKKTLPFLSITIFITLFLTGYGLIKLSDKADLGNSTISINTIYTSILSEDKEDKEARKSPE